MQWDGGEKINETENDMGGRDFLIGIVVTVVAFGAYLLGAAGADRVPLFPALPACIPICPDLRRSRWPRLRGHAPGSKPILELVLRLILWGKLIRATAPLRSCSSRWSIGRVCFFRRPQYKNGRVKNLQTFTVKRLLVE